MIAKKLFTSTLLLLIFMAGCKKGADYRPLIYFTDTEQFSDKTLTIDGPAAMGLSITSTIKVAEDINVKIKERPELLN